MHATTGATDMAALKLAKQQLRGLMKSRLAAISRESTATQSTYSLSTHIHLLTCPGRLAFEALKSFQPYKEARHISVYLSMPGGEIQTDAIVRDALSSGKKVFIPFLLKSDVESPGTPSRIMDMVQLHSISDYESLKPDRWGIPSIDPITVKERRCVLGFLSEKFLDADSALDLILMPGVAFDVAGGTRLIRRLGHGKGFYDFFIHRYMASVASSPMPEVRTRPVLLYGLSLTEQFLCRPSDTPVPVGPFDQHLHGVIHGDGRVTTAENSFTQ